MFDNRDMVKPTIMHQPQRVHRRMLRRQMIRSPGHHRIEMGLSRILAVGQQAHSITPGEGVVQAALSIDNQNRADAVLAHEPARVLYGCRGCQGDR